MTSSPETPLLEIEDISIKFGEFTAVSHVNVVVQPGQIVGVIGPNGAGKTTLVNAVFGINHPATGRIVLRGRDLGKLSASRRARLGMSRTFQNLELFGSMTVYENVITHADAVMGADAPSFRRGSRAIRLQRHARTRGILEDLGIWDLAGARVDQLAYPQKKVVEFARAMVADVQLVLLDEPTAGVALEERREVIARMQEHMRARQVAAIVVEHDMEVIRTLCQHVYVMDGGHLISSGTFDEVVADPKVREAYLGPEAVLATSPSTDHAGSDPAKRDGLRG